MCFILRKIVSCLYAASYTYSARFTVISLLLYGCFSYWQCVLEAVFISSWHIIHKNQTSETMLQPQRRENHWIKQANLLETVLAKLIIKERMVVLVRNSKPQSGAWHVSRRTWYRRATIMVEKSLKPPAMAYRMEQLFLNDWIPCLTARTNVSALLAHRWCSVRLCGCWERGSVQ